MRSVPFSRSALGSAVLALLILLSACSSVESPASSPSESSSPDPAEPVITDRPLSTQLAEAIGSQDLLLVEALLEAGADVHSTVGRDIWPLHLAAAGTSPEIIRVLIEAGADLEVRTPSEATPLHRAAQDGSGEVVTALLEAGALTDVVMRDIYGSRPLNLAAQFFNNDALEALLQFGVDVETRTENFQATALSSAAHAGNLEGVQILVAYGADLGALNAQGRTALFWARDGGHRDVIEYLIGIGAPE